MNITDWNGYEKINFSVNGRDGLIVCPKTPLEGNPWVWRAEFFDAFNYVDVELLKKGWFLVYYSVSDMYGCPASIEMMKEFYSVATGEYKLSKKPAIFGFSRGGLYATNFALTYPEYCGLLYLDAPVLDIRSWPAGFGTGCGDPESWEQCKKLYSLTDETAKDYKMNPLDRTEELAKTNIPVFLVCGASDSVVPYSENGLPFFEKMKKSSATIEQIVKPNCEHHPHSLSEPKPIVDFIEKMYGYDT